MKVNLFIVGFSKCGTTSLYDILVKNQYVKGGKSKEPAFFSSVKGKNETNSFSDWTVGGRFNLGLNWYNQLFEGVEAKFLIEASTIYSFDENSPKLIYEYNSQAKLIFVVRNPYKRIESHYYQEVKNGMKLPDFEQLVKENHERFRFYVEVSKYKKSIERFVKIFGENNILVLNQNELNNIDSLSIKLSNFLNIQIELEKLNEISNKRKKSIFPGLKRFLISIERSKLAHAMPVGIQQFGSRVMRKIDKILLKEVKTLNNQIPLDLQNMVNKEFEEDLNYLNEKYKINLLQ